MRVVINSDVLFHGPPVEEALSEAHQRFLEACREKGHTVVLPLTAKLEFDRDQEEKRQGKIGALEKAYRLLEQYGVEFERVDPKALIRPSDLVALIRVSGVQVEVIEPTLDDYREAHRRAALHESPQPPGSDGDEMRDLVIWMIALRLAREDGAALLLSRDKVHTHERGDAEAKAAGLIRLANLDEALTHFEIGTPSARAMMQILASVWDKLRAGGLPLADKVELRRLDEAMFVETFDGLSASGLVTLPTDDGKALQADIGVQMLGGGREEVALSNVRTEDGRSLAALTVEGVAPELEILPSTYDDRLGALRELFRQEP